jgi:hypothetical protein
MQSELFTYGYEMFLYFRQKEYPVDLRKFQGSSARAWQHPFRHLVIARVSGGTQPRPGAGWCPMDSRLRGNNNLIAWVRAGLLSTPKALISVLPQALASL